MSCTEILFLEVLELNEKDKINNSDIFIDDSSEVVNMFHQTKDDYKIGVMEFYSNEKKQYQTSIYITYGEKNATNLIRKITTNSDEANNTFKETVNFINFSSVDDILKKCINFYK